MITTFKNLTANLSFLTLTLLLSAGCSLPLFAAEWHHEAVDPNSGGTYSSMRADTSGNLHLAYFDQLRGLLKYGFWDHRLRKWFNTTVDSSRGFCSLALDSKQNPHISYLVSGEGQMKYAHWNGTSWEKEVIHLRAKDISYYTSIVLDAADNPIISYYEYQGMGEDYSLQLREVEWKGKYWGGRTIDTTPGSGKFNAMASDSAGNIHAVYANVKDENASLRYARWNGSVWVSEVLEGPAEGRANFPVFSVSIALDKKGQPHITYTDVRNRIVKYATRRDGKWDLVKVDAMADVAYPDRNGIAVDDDGTPYISYYDAGAGVLKLAHRVNQKWFAEVVDQNSAGFTSSLQIDHGVIWLTYTDQISGILKFAYRAVDGSDPATAAAASSK